ncbi:MAG TPA: DUF305 domain-containing protein [Longimicrobiales bacterium]
MSATMPTRAALLATLVLGACSAGIGNGGTAIVQAGAPGEPSRPVQRSAPAIRAAYTPADVRFMQDMIVHHMQAVHMTELAEQRATRDDVRTLSRRIAASQSGEIDLMERWLTARGEPVSAASKDGGHAHMPGMLTPAEMDLLERASGVAFDRLLLESMIRHHQGALTMVAGLRARDNSGVEPELHQFLSSVDTDQRAELARMRALLGRDFKQVRP